MNLIAKISRQYNIHPIIENGKTVIRTNQGILKMILHWEEDLSELSALIDESLVKKDLIRNDMIAKYFTALVNEHGAKYLASDIDSETGRHQGVGIQAADVKSLVVLNENLEIIAEIKATCVDCPWEGGYGPSYLSLVEEFELRGLEILPPGEVSDEIKEALPKVKYVWELITLTNHSGEPQPEVRYV